MQTNPIATLERGGFRESLLLGAATLALRLPILVLPFFAKDEATYSALAAKMLSGSLFYVGAVDHKPPGIALTYALVFWLTGRYRLVFVRFLLLAIVTATGVLLGETARLLQGSPRARIAGLLYVLASAIGLPGDMQAANTELFLNLPLAAASVLVVRVLVKGKDPRPQSRDAAALAAAGLLTGIGALFKYQAAAAGVAWVLAVLAGGGGGRRITTRLAALAAGIAPVVLGLCGFFWLRGAWSAFLFWGWEYNFQYMSLLSPAAVLGNAFFYTVVVALFWLPLVVCLGGRGAPRPFVAVAWLLAMVPAVAAGGRFSPHYFLMALPPVCILGAPRALSIAESRSGPRQLVAVFTALTMGVTLALSWLWYDIKPGLKDDERAYVAVGDYVKAHSSPGDRVFVWGNSPEIYFYANRVMATRFAFCNYHTGKIWGTDAADTDILDTDRFVVPRAWDELLIDFRRAPPAVIVDAAAGKLDGFALNAASRYPDLWEIIERSYTAEAVVDGVPVYRWTGPVKAAPHATRAPADPTRGGSLAD